MATHLLSPEQLFLSSFLSGASSHVVKRHEPEGKKRSFNWNIKKRGEEKKNDWGINGCNLCCFCLQLFYVLFNFERIVFSWKSADWMWVWLSSRCQEDEVKRFLILLCSVLTRRLLDSIRCAVRVTRHDAEQLAQSYDNKSIQVCTQEEIAQLLVKTSSSLASFLVPNGVTR